MRGEITESERFEGYVHVMVGIDSGDVSSVWRVPVARDGDMVQLGYR